MVLHFVEPWVSETDIAGGDRWAIEIAKELEKSNFGIICLTRENIESPWILFEAGSLAKSLKDSRVVPLLLDIDFSEISGPLAQFQAKKVDVASLRDIVRSVNQAAPSPIDNQRLDRQFDALWQQFDKQLGAITKLTSHPSPRRPQHEVLEELVSTVRTIEQRTRTLEEALSRQQLIAPRPSGIIGKLRFPPPSDNKDLASPDPLAGQAVESAPDFGPWEEEPLSQKDLGSNE
jgi:hypothetical protein